MIEILLLMFGGMLLGYLIRHKKSIISIAERLTVWSIFLLLFLMGLSIGRDPLILGNLPSLGLTALLISISGILGSLAMAWLIWKFVFNKKP
jgi:predicted Kef-type K+ transport protein